MLPDQFRCSSNNHYSILSRCISIPSDLVKVRWGVTLVGLTSSRSLHLIPTTLTVLQSSEITASVQMSTKHIQMPSTFRLFLQLPREIRDLCYEHMLVRNVVPVECAITKPSSARVSAAYEDLEKVFPLRAARRYRKIWSVPTFDMELDFNNNHSGEPAAVCMTYQLAREATNHSGQRVSRKLDLNLNILQVSKQVYTEAIKIFHGNNVFSFTGDFRIPTAFTFLVDRPATSLRLIKSLELALLEDANMRGTPQAHYPIIRRSTDSLVLQYAYHYFTELCTLLSTSRIQLRRLYLTVENTSVCVSSPDTSENLQEGILWETKQLKGGRIEAPLWLEPLLKIEGLQSVGMFWVFWQPHFQRMAHTAEVMQQYMLAKPQNDTSRSPSTESRASDLRFHFRLMKTIKSETPLGRDDSYLWENIVLSGDQIHYTAKKNTHPRDPSQATKLTPHLEWTLDPGTDIYVCSCTMNCT
jgi:hypothetical protein